MDDLELQEPADVAPRTIRLFFASVDAKNYFLARLSDQLPVKVDLGMNDTVPLFEVEEVSVRIYGENGEYFR